MPRKASFGGKKVIIIGAGVSGIKAAHTLAKKGIRVLILEISDKIGGRLDSFKFCNQTFERGANWI